MQATTQKFLRNIARLATTLSAFAVVTLVGIFALIGVAQPGFLLSAALLAKSRRL